MAEINGHALRMGRWRAARWIGTGSLFATVAMRIIRTVPRVIGPDAKRAAVDQAELVVGQIYVLETLANKGVAVDLVYVTVAQIQGDDIVVRVTLRLQYLNERVVAIVKRRIRVVMVIGGRVAC